MTESPRPCPDAVLAWHSGEELDVKPFEADLYALFDARHKDLLEEIATKKEISDDLRKRLITALDNFLSTRVPATGATQAA